MKVLVTGGAGYIGSHATESLIQSGYEVVLIDNFSTGHRSLIHPQAHLVEGDIRDTALVKRILSEQKIESILHFAARTSVPESLAAPQEFYANNLGGTVSLMEALAGSSVKTFVFSSTAAVYMDPGVSLVTEQSATAPITPYGQSKLMSEKVIQDCAQALGFKYLILRYFNVAGASSSGKLGQMGEDSQVLVKRAALVAAGKQKSFSIFGTDYPTADGTAIRDFIHVEDLAEVHVEALMYLANGGSSEILNCGYGHGFSVRQVVDAMKSVSGQDFLVVQMGRRPGDLAQVVADSSRLQKLFNWKPKRDDLRLICESAYRWEKR